MKTTRVYLLVTFSTVFWGANFVLAGPVLVDESPLWAAALRFLLGALLMIALAGWRGETLVGHARRHSGTYAVLGAVGILTFNLLFFYALQRTSPTNAALIMATNPLLTTLLATLMLGERATFSQLAALPLALLGVMLVVSGGDLTHLAALHIATGDILMLIANLAWALYNVLSRRYMPAGTAVVNTTLIMVAGAVLLLVVALGSGQPLVVPGVQATAALLTMAVGGTVLAYLFWNTGIAHLGAGRTALFINLVPVFAMLAAAVTGTLPSAAQLMGGAVVIAAVSVSSLRRRGLAVA